VGLIFELEESDFAGYIEDGEIYNAQLVQTNMRERNFPSEPQPVKRVGWKFRIESDDPHDGQDIWGETSTKFVNHPGCKLKSWAEALLGQDLPAGYRLDVDTLLDRHCRVIVGKREYEKEGETKTHNFVREVHPTRENMAAMAQAEPAEPF
jgi:hypothetical protein